MLMVSQGVHEAFVIDVYVSVQRLCSYEGVAKGVHMSVAKGVYI